MSLEIAQEIARKTTQIATLPEITIEIITVVNDPTSCADDLEKLVSNDPVLSTRILRVVNSSFYDLSNGISTIERAIVLLGLNAVKNIAISTSLIKMFEQAIKCDDFTSKDLWTHCVAVGAMNKLIVQVIGIPVQDEAFLVGLIHDLGLVSLMQCYGDQIPEIVAVCKSGVTFRQAEQQVLGADHQEIGLELARKWSFPPAISNVIGYHHNPTSLQDEEERLLAIVTFISDNICAAKKFGLTLTAESKSIPKEYLDEIGLSGEQLQECVKQIDAELEVVREIFD